MPAAMLLVVRSRFSLLLHPLKLLGRHARDLILVIVPVVIQSFFASSVTGARVAQDLDILLLFVLLAVAPWLKSISLATRRMKASLVRRLWPLSICSSSLPLPRRAGPSGGSQRGFPSSNTLPAC